MTIAPLRLMLVDEDPVFRLGLRIWLEQSAGYQVVAEATQAGDTLAILSSRAGLAADAADRPAGPGAEAQGDSLPDLDLVILDLGLGAGRPDQLPGLHLCADIKARYPNLPVLVLSAQAEPVLEAAARQMGADGFGARSMAVADLGALLQRLAEPQVAPQILPQTNLVGSENQPVSRQERPDPAAPLPNALAVLRFNLRQSSVQQIEAVMAQIEAEQRRGRGTLLSEAVLAGRYRELRAARWLVRRLLATPSVTSPVHWRMPVAPSVGSQTQTSWARLQPEGASLGRLARDACVMAYREMPWRLQPPIAWSLTGATWPPWCLSGCLPSCRGCSTTPAAYPWRPTCCATTKSGSCCTCCCAK
jgi:DNA-binding NarL/FixJ family response regulator